MDQAQVVRLLAKLGVEQEDLARVRMSSYPESERLLGELKERVRVRWRKLAVELHPDATGNDPEKTAEFVQLNQVRADFDGCRVAPMDAPVEYVPYRRPSYAVTPFAYQGTATPVNPWVAARMRPRLVVFGEPVPLAFSSDAGLGPFLVFLDLAPVGDGIDDGGAVAFQSEGPGSPAFGAVGEDLPSFEEGLEELGVFWGTVVQPEEDGRDLGAVAEAGQGDAAAFDVHQLLSPAGGIRLW